MAFRSVRLALGALAFAALALGGCNRAEDTAKGTSPVTPPVSAPEPFRVTSLELGNALDAGKKITAPSREFAPSDTIYAAVASEGASPSATIVARWTFEDGQLVSEDSQSIAPTGPASTEFHLSKPGGLPPGKYKVEVMEKGSQSSYSREFEVK
jgi:hypothetical protein